MVFLFHGFKNITGRPPLESFQSIGKDLILVESLDDNLMKEIISHKEKFSHDVLKIPCRITEGVGILGLVICTDSQQGNIVDCSSVHNFVSPKFNPQFFLEN